MKRITKEAVLIIIAVISLLFLVTVYFVGFDDEGLIFSTVGGKFGTVQSEASISEAHKKIENVTTADVPVIRYTGGTRMVGDAILVEELFQIECEDGTIISAAEDEKGSILLVDVMDTADNVVITKLSTADVEALEDIPTAFIYDKEQQILHFHRSGVYKVYIKYYSGSEYGVLYEFLLPVEVGDL